MNNYSSIILNKYLVAMNNTQQIYSYSNVGIYLEFLAENLIITAAKTIKEEDVAVADRMSELGFFISIFLYTMPESILLLNSYFSFF